jgi:hypothetical protein
MKTNPLLEPWDLGRILRLGLSFFLLYDGYRSQEWLILLLGGVLLTMAVLNVGCFGSRSCATSQKQTTSNTKDEVEFEEVLSPK